MSTITMAAAPAFCAFVALMKNEQVPRRISTAVPVSEESLGQLTQELLAQW